MVSRDFAELSADRAARARFLAKRVPPAAEALEFFAKVADFRASVFQQLQHESAQTAECFREALVELAHSFGPPALREAALRIDRDTFEKAWSGCLDRIDTTSIRSFFARALAPPFLFGKPRTGAPFDRGCPDCGHDPQVAALRPQGHGRALSLICSLCLREWPFSRGVCPRCFTQKDGDLAFYAAPDFAHIQLQMCDACKRYLHCIDLAADPQAIPEVDEMSAPALDLWAQQEGYRKIQPNLAGI